MNELVIKNIDDISTLKKVFKFLAETFYEDAVEHDEHYEPMTERYAEMKEQLTKDSELLLYIEDQGNIVGALTSKDMDIKEQKITLGVIAVSKDYRNHRYGEKLVKEFEKRCVNKNIFKISLGARYRACRFYVNLGYTPQLMVQVCDFTTVDDVKKANKYNLKPGREWQGDVNGFIFFKVDEVKKEYVQHFEKKLKTAYPMYYFSKELVKGKTI